MSVESSTRGPRTDGKAVLILVALLVLATWNYLDRAAVGILQEPIKHEFGLSDFQLGLLGGPAFAFLYVILGLPFARLAERYQRVRIIVTVFALWSVMTALCGLAGSYLALLLTRAGVSVGEAGCTPSAHSLIADQFPPDRRPWALAVYSSGLSLGSLIAALAGGAIAQRLGWRPTFYMLGATGLVFAMLFPVVVPEPRRTTAIETTPSFVQAIGFLAGRSVIRHIVLGTMVAGLMGYSMTQYMTSYFMRSHQMLIGNATVRVALIVGAAGAFGTYVGGLVGNRLEKRRRGAAALAAAWGFVVATPLQALGFLAPSAMLATVLLMAGAAAQLSYFGPAFAILHANVQPRMRGTAIAVVLLATNLVGYGLGPPIVGAASDALQKLLAARSPFALHLCATSDWLNQACQAPRAGGLQWALTLLAAANLWAFYHFLRVSRFHSSDSDEPAGPYALGASVV
jgi:predicted MFS family arabinose efflux permease